MAKKIDTIVIHNSASTFGTINIFRKWHVEERGWRDVGYHYAVLNGNLGNGVILESLDGSIEVGRPLLNANKLLEKDEIGAHAFGVNSHSLGIVLVGDGTYTMKQRLSVKALTLELMKKFDVKVANVLGHREVPGTHKRCPEGFDMDDFREKLTWAEKGRQWH